MKVLKGLRVNVMTNTLHHLEPTVKQQISSISLSNFICKRFEFLPLQMHNSQEQKNELQKLVK